MEKLIYINLDFLKYKSKATSQIKAFNNLDIKTEVATIENIKDTCFFVIYSYNKGDFEVKIKKKITKAYAVEQGNNSVPSLIKRFIKTLKINNLFQKELINYYNDNNYDYCYIRRIGFFIIFLRKMFKKISKNTKILYEIPTYPLDKYDSILVNFSQKIEMFCFNLYLKKYIYKIPVIVQNDIKLDDKMISIFNGVDYERFSNIKEDIPVIKNKTINMIIIAHILPWHGYDRLINSIKEYNGNYNIKLDIYSDINSEVSKLKTLVDDNNLNDCISFKGNVEMETIKKNISKYHVAIGSLGYHRRNGKYDTSIKNKEYCALGLPMVCSCDDISFPKNFKYIYKVSSDDCNFSIDEIIDWYLNLRDDNYKKEMRSFAKKELNYEKVYKNVFEKNGDN